MHFAEGRWTNSEIPVERFVGPAIVIDVAAKAAANPDYLLTVEDIAAWETAHGRIPEKAIVLLRTGWSARWPDKRAYLGDDTPGDATHLHFPSFGPEAAAWLAKERRPEPDRRRHGERRQRIRRRTFWCTGSSAPPISAGSRTSPISTSCRPRAPSSSPCR